MNNIKDLTLENCIFAYFPFGALNIVSVSNLIMRNIKFENCGFGINSRSTEISILFVTQCNIDYARDITFHRCTTYSQHLAFISNSTCETWDFKFFEHTDKLYGSDYNSKRAFYISDNKK